MVISSFHRLLVVSAFGLVAACASSPSSDGALARQDADVTVPGEVSSSARWVAGDLHVHAECGDDRLTSAQLLRQMETAGIEVASHLVWGLDWEKLHRSFDGQDDPASTPRRILHPDLEISGFAAGQAGHLVLLGLSNVDFARAPTAAPLSGLPITDWALGQGERVVVGYSHAWAWPKLGYPASAEDTDCTPFELPITASEGKATFFVEEAHPGNAKDLGADLARGPLSTGGFALWKALQNTGYRIAIGGGSDNGCLSDLIGKPRTLALVDGDLSYDRFLDAVRKGRTILAGDKRDRVDLVIQSARIGSEVLLAKPDELDLTVRSDLAGAGEVEVLVNGEVARRVAVPAGPHEELAVVSLERSSWIALRTAHVLTSPIYVVVGGAPIRASSNDACWLVKYVDHLKKLANRATRPEQPLYLGEEKPATFARWDAAAAVFALRFREAGGTSCE